MADWREPYGPESYSSLVDSDFDPEGASFEVRTTDGREWTAHAVREAVQAAPERPSEAD